MASKSAKTEVITIRIKEELLGKRVVVTVPPDETEISYLVVDGMGDSKEGRINLGTLFVRSLIGKKVGDDFVVGEDATMYKLIRIESEKN